jgi:hypothetical protein
MSLLCSLIRASAGAGALALLSGCVVAPIPVGTTYATAPLQTPAPATTATARQPAPATTATARQPAPAKPAPAACARDEIRVSSGECRPRNLYAGGNGGGGGGGGDSGGGGWQ